LDLDRTLALDLGVSGAPETFLVDANGTILLHHTGDINPRVWRAKFAPVMQELSE
ncbi:thiol:disulfide interchange protein, partial [Pseudoalteromonas phenolica O-BC30]